jgi:hypothetical protein
LLSKDGKSTWNNSQMEIGGPYTLSDLKVAKPEIWVLGSNGAKPGLRDK